MLHKTKVCYPKWVSMEHCSQHLMLTWHCRLHCQMWLKLAPCGSFWDNFAFKVSIAGVLHQQSCFLVLNRKLSCAPICYTRQLLIQQCCSKNWLCNITLTFQRFSISRVLRSFPCIALHIPTVRNFTRH